VARNEVETVYNLRVAEHHTYFVGSEAWGFSVWAHNADYAILPHPSGTGSALAVRQADGTFVWVTNEGTTQIIRHDLAADALKAIGPRDTM